jgi:hypothetical protein
LNRSIYISLVALALLALQVTASAAQQYDASGQQQPAPDPDGWDVATPPPPPAVAPAPGTPVPVESPPPPPRPVAWSGLRNQADISPTDLEFLESIVLDALIPLSSRGFQITPDEHASRFCDDACNIALASQAGREFLIHGEVAGSVGGYGVTLKLHRVDDGLLLYSAATDARPLLGDLVAPTTEAASKLVQALEAAQTAPPPAPPPPPPPPVAPPPPPATDQTYWWPTDKAEDDPGDDEDEADGFPYPTRGIELELRGGFNFCAESGDATCNNYEMGGGGGVFVGVRIAPVFAAGLDFGIYGLRLKDTEGRSDVRVSTRHFMLVPRLYLPFRVVEIYAEVGLLFMGYYEQGKIDDENYKVRISSWTTFRLGVGVSLYIVRSDRVGDIGLGLDLDYDIFNPRDVELCGDPVAQGNKCDDMPWGTYISMIEDQKEQEEDIEFDLSQDHVNFLQFSFHLTWLIPVF